MSKKKKRARHRNVDPKLQAEYRCWLNMIQRCHNSKHPRYRQYGGRGVHVCDRWRESFDNFMADIGPRPFKGTLDRIDNNKGYSKENCRWAGWDVQACNRGKNRFYELDGEKITPMGLAKITGVKSQTIWEWMNKGKTPLTPKQVIERAKTYYPKKRPRQKPVQLSFKKWIELMRSDEPKEG